MSNKYDGLVDSEKKVRNRMDDAARFAGGMLAVAMMAIAYLMAYILVGLEKHPKDLALKLFLGFLVMFCIAVVSWMMLDIIKDNIKDRKKHELLEEEQRRIYKELPINVRENNIKTWSEYIAYLAKIVKRVQNEVNSGLNMKFHERVRKDVADALKFNFGIDEEMYDMIYEELNGFAYCDTVKDAERLMELKIKHERWAAEEIEIEELEHSS
jgi:uncharacterized protein with PQ loop repeat